jgi:hypothetical protein
MAWLRRFGSFNTGWVNVPIGSGDGWWLDGTGTVQVRRHGGSDPALDSLDIRFTNVGVLAAAPAIGYLTPLGFLPAGFRAWYNERAAIPLGNVNGDKTYQVRVMQGARLRLQGGDQPGTGSQAIQGTLSLLADGARPGGY